MELIHNTNKGVFDIFRFSQKYKMFQIFESVFGIVGVFVKAIDFLISDSDSLYLTLYGDMV